MFKLLRSYSKTNKLWNFDGGIHLPEMKLQSSKVPIRTCPLPEFFIIPLQQHLGSPAELLVKMGDSVLKGQPLTSGHDRALPVHAPSSGIISAIKPHIVAHPSGLSEPCIQIIPDGKDIGCEPDPPVNYRQLTAQQLLEKIHLAGIAGLGGAGFPTASKLASGLDSNEILIINAVECEPYITADDRLIQEHANEIIMGIRILMSILGSKQVLIGIEDNKPEAITALKKALNDDEIIQLRIVPTKYPSGGAKQLTKILTGREVPPGKHSSSIGVMMQNVATVFAIKRAIIDNQPLIERVVTLTGDALSNPGNFWVRLGTPVSHLLTQAGFQPPPRPILIMGGPLMGFTLPSQDVPIVKISNCIVAAANTEIAIPEPEQPCIRCGLCVEACPARLLPQQLYWFSRAGEHEKARNHHLFDCIECGACAYVCPSHIPLVQYYRQEKAEIRALDQETLRGAEAKKRFEAKKMRLQREKLAREQHHNLLSTSRSPSSTALTKNQPSIAINEIAPSLDKLMENNTAEPEDRRQAIIAAAIARAKAKKAAQSIK
ncbi:electron transport complex subunit RsxC [Candidatus Regiella endosymbiont of Tuberolachnus salignus]|uniref:electron transport complex subunit RsxC n=1 Tax=Candidatus Regiella endosymbiont of Tuberolachnus salignus TaxID=3077956 RepID=UPI0030D028BE